MRLKIAKTATAVMMCALAISAAVPAIPAYARSRTYVSSTRSSDISKMRSAAGEVQKAFDKQDLDKLANLCAYPLAVSFSDGTLLDIKNKSELKALGQSTVFSQKMRDAIASTNVAKLENGDYAGVQMGGDNGLALFKINGTWKVNNIYMDTAQGASNESVNISSLPEMAQQVQKTFYYKSLDTLAMMSSYPMVISYENGTHTEIKTPQQLIALGEDKVFTDKLLKAIDKVDVNTLKEVGDIGVQMGGDSGLIMYNTNGYWKINQIYQ